MATLTVQAVQGPSHVNVTGITSSAAAVSWSVVPGATHYTLRYRPVTSSFWTTLALGSNSANLSGLLAATSYVIQVRAVCAGGGGNWTPLTGFATTDGTACTAATLNLLSPSCGSALVGWAPIPGASHYTVQYRRRGFTFWTNVGASSNHYLITGLAQGTEYEARVRPICGNLTVAFGTPTAFATSACRAVEALRTESPISIYPNPNDGVFNVEIFAEREETAEINVYRSDGKQVWRKEIEVLRGKNAVSVEIPTAGMYWVVYRNGEMEYVSKVTVFAR